MHGKIMATQQIYYSYMESPLGNLLLAGHTGVLLCLGFPDRSVARQPESGWLRRNALFAPVKQQIDEYLEGKRTQFDLSIEPQGSDFQRAVWQAMLDIPYGETRSYGELAKVIGRPSASRAVGAAAGRNPIPLIVPCHRVIGSDGGLVGFGGGIPTKKYLLALEQSSQPFSLASQ